MIIGLTDSEADCLNENCDLKNQINQFVNQNEVTLNDPELAFANTVIDQLSDSCGMDFEVDFDEQIIEDATFLNNDCLRNMYIQAGGAETFANYLNNFDGDMSVANLKLAANPNLQDNVNAQTSAPENYLINLEFNPNNLDRPSLSIARTFIH